MGVIEGVVVSKGKLPSIRLFHFLLGAEEGWFSSIKFN